jgi:hypothetical protein
VNAFALSSNGDEAVLSSANAAGDLTGLTEFVSFGASEPGVSFGRHTVVRPSFNKTFFTAMAAQTFGAANSQPRVGPIIISEFQYVPTLGLPEFVEIWNNGMEPIPLFDPANPANTWRVAGVNFNLPPGITLQPRQFLVVSATDPNAFRTSYNVPATVLVAGPFQPEDLSNSGERLALQKPGMPYIGSSGQTIVPYIDVDSVTYGTTSPPWPGSGSGRSIERSNLFGFGEDPGGWKQSLKIPGSVGAFSPVSFSNWQNTLWFVGDPASQGFNADPDGDGLTNAMEFFMGLNPRGRDSENAVVPSVVTVGADQHLLITFRRSLSLPTGPNPPAVTFAVEGSSNLTDWDNQTTPVGTAVNNGDGTQTLTYRDNIPMTGTTRRFMRVRALIP